MKTLVGGYHNSLSADVLPVLLSRRLAERIGVHVAQIRRYEAGLPAHPRCHSPAWLSLGVALDELRLPRKNSDRMSF